MSDWRETVLCCLLDCGSADLSLLDDFNGDIYQVVEACREECGNTGINTIVRCIFGLGYDDMQGEINFRIRELESLAANGEISDAEREELDQIKKLNPWDDFESYHNYLDTSVWVERNAEIYQKYLRKELDAFEEFTGFSIQSV